MIKLVHNNFFSKKILDLRIVFIFSPSLKKYPFFVFLSQACNVADTIKHFVKKFGYLLNKLERLPLTDISTLV